MDQIRQLTASGRLEAGDRLPSVRAIATELGINAMTISKAYSLLEQEGLVLRHDETNMVVAKTHMKPLDAIHPQVLALVRIAKHLGCSRKDTIEAVDRVWKSEQEKQ